MIRRLVFLVTHGEMVFLIRCHFRALYCIVFIHFYSTSRSLQPFRCAPDHSNWHCIGVYTPKRYRQLQVKDLPKVPTWRLELQCCFMICNVSVERSQTIILKKLSGKFLTEIEHKCYYELHFWGWHTFLNLILCQQFLVWYCCISPENGYSWSSLLLYIADQSNAEIRSHYHSVVLWSAMGL